MKAIYMEEEALWTNKMDCGHPISCVLDNRWQCGQKGESLYVRRVLQKLIFWDLCCCHTKKDCWEGPCRSFFRYTTDYRMQNGNLQPSQIISYSRCHPTCQTFCWYDDKDLRECPMIRTDLCWPSHPSLNQNIHDKKHVHFGSSILI